MRISLVVGGLLTTSISYARNDDVEQTRQRPPDPIVTYVDYEEEHPERLPYPSNGYIPPGYVVKSKGKVLFWAVGSALVLTLPLLTLGPTANTEMTRAWIPLVGPWMAIGQFDAERYRNPQNPLGPLGVVVVLAADGVMQGVGWGFLAYAALSTKGRYLIREDMAVVPAALPGGGWSLNWSGTF